MAAGLEENVFAATILWMPRMGMTARSQPRLSLQSGVHTTNSTQTLHSTIHSADYPRVTVCRICVSNPTKSLHKQYTNPTRRREKFHRPPASKNGKM